MLRTVSVCIGSLFLGTGLAWLLLAPRASRDASAAAPSAEPTGRESARWNEMLAALERIETRLEMPSPSASLPPDETRRTPVATPALEEELRAMATAVDGLRRALEAHAVGSGTGESLQALRDQSPQPNWQGLDDLIRRWKVDEELTCREVLLLGYREVLERYGTPSRIYQNEDGVRWVYTGERDPITGARREVVFRFFDGLVQLVSVTSR